MDIIQVAERWPVSSQTGHQSLDGYSPTSQRVGTRWLPTIPTYYYVDGLVQGYDIPTVNTLETPVLHWAVDMMTAFQLSPLKIQLPAAMCPQIAALNKSTSFQES